MALVHKKSASRNIMIIAGIGVLLIVLFFIFRDTLFGGGTTTKVTNAPVTSDAPIVTDLGEDLFEDSRFTSLRDLTNASLDTTTRGNPEPFKPFP